MSLSRYPKYFLDVLSKKQKLKIEFLIKKKKKWFNFSAVIRSPKIKSVDKALPMFFF
jgi:hypothetical protein